MYYIGALLLFSKAYFQALEQSQSLVVATFQTARLYLLLQQMALLGFFPDSYAEA